ncbi:bifunctional riboflavin kinase/FAD synthetase [Neobacillus sp. D3-1R]|uniref:bifunctional riboflavin kinase/FAD synthetase n=1 Tax=Neobacillus sp. D3-1R TaxID=3445778 RepID=UPI003F9F504A
MEVIKLQHPHKMSNFPPMVMALGYFDGVHLGHQKVINEAKEEAKKSGLKSAVMTFDPHPSVVLGKGQKHVKYISPLDEKIRIFDQLGIDYVFIVSFTQEFANLLPQEFVDEYIIGLNVKHVVAGFDFSYGRMGKGTMETLPFHSRNEFHHTVIPKLAKEGEKISSTLIRQYILNGKTEELLNLLGRYYQTVGEVIHGDKRGRTIGFPTANIDMADDYLLPPLGVYAVRIEVEGNWYDGVCNVGHKPTFNHGSGDKPTVEVHIFDFNKEIYGQIVKVEWHKYIRKEQKFNGINELVAQIEKDKKFAMNYLENIVFS